MFIWCYSPQAMFGQFEIEDNPVIRKRNSMRMKVEGMVPNIFTRGRRNSNMELIKVILSDENLNEAIKRVKSHKGAAGGDKMTVYEIDEYFEKNKESIKQSILEKKYKPQLLMVK